MLGPSCTTDSGEYEPKQTHKPGSFKTKLLSIRDTMSILPQVNHETWLRSKHEPGVKNREDAIVSHKTNKKQQHNFRSVLDHVHNQWKKKWMYCLFHNLLWTLSFTFSFVNHRLFDQSALMLFHRLSLWIWPKGTFSISTKLHGELFVLLQ